MRASITLRVWPGMAGAGAPVAGTRRDLTCWPRYPSPRALKALSGRDVADVAGVRGYATHGIGRRGGGWQATAWYDTSFRRVSAVPAGSGERRGKPRLFNT